jgi:hypothetical protein
MKDVFRGTYSEVINIKNLIENIEIKAFIANELMANIEPWAVTSAGLNPVVLKVADEDFEKAIEIIKEYLSGNLSL